jgi:hypothetical protein
MIHAVADGAGVWVAAGTIMTAVAAIITAIARRTPASGVKADYADRLVGASVGLGVVELEEGITAELFTPLLQESFDEVGWDISSTRSTGPNKKDLEMAEFYCQQAESNPDTSWDKIVANFERLNFGLEIPREDDGSVTLEAMAIAVKVNRTRVEGETLI